MITANSVSGRIDATLSFIVGEMTEFLRGKGHELSADALLGLREVGRAISEFVDEVRGIGALEQTVERLAEFELLATEPGLEAKEATHQELFEVVRGHQDHMLSVLEALCDARVPRREASKLVARVMGPMYTKVIGPLSAGCPSGSRSTPSR